MLLRFIYWNKFMILKIIKPSVLKSAFSKNALLIGAFASQDLHQAVENMGYIVDEDLSGVDITERYFHDRADHIRHTHGSHLIHLKIA